MALPFTLKKLILRQKKKNYGNSNIFSTCKNIIIIFTKKSSKKKKNPKILQDNYKHNILAYKARLEMQLSLDMYLTQ
jgi:hypothetical protein